jgi:structural maintenance of chromosome 1
LPKKSDRKRKATEEEEEEEDVMEIEIGESATQDEQIIRTLDFSSTKKKEVKSQKQYEKVNQQYVEEIQNINVEIEKINPNLKAVEKLSVVSERLGTLNKDWTNAKDESDKISERFAEVKQLRYQKFMEAYERIAKTIDDIYKSLTNIPASVASLTLENRDEPYLEGIKYNAIPPNKRFRDMDQLSGGEKTLAALALLFAIHSYQPSPFFVLDEVDAALDPANVSKIVNYIKKRSTDVQCIVISLKHSFFEMADALVGIYRDEGNSSRTLTLDLKPYVL